MAAKLRELGWEVQEEYKGCDIRADKDGKAIAVEIETGRTHTDQLRRNLKHDLQWTKGIVIVTATQDISIGLQEWIRLEGLHVPVIASENVPEYLAMFGLPTTHFTE